MSRVHPAHPAHPAARDPRRRRALPYLALTLVGAAIFLPGLGAHDLWNPDEPRYAQVAREMRQRGDLLVPHLNDRIYDQKPPVHFWLVAAAAELTGGVDEWSARLPSAAAAIGSILLVFALADGLFDRRAAWLSAIVHATTFKVLWQGRVGQIDMLLTFFVVLAIWLWARGWLAGSSRGTIAFFLVAGVATLTKGPVGLLPPLLSIVVFLAWSGDREALRRLRVGRGLAVWAAVVAAWLLPAAAVAGGEYLETMLFTQNVTRYRAPVSFGGTIGHLRPWYHYLTVIPAELLPWTVFLPLAASRWWHELDPRWRRGFRFAFCWFAVTLVFFSLSPGKRSVYVVPLYPALALWIGAGLARWSAGRDRRWELALPAAIVAVLFAALAVAVPWVLGRVDGAAALSAAVVPAAILALSLAAMGGVAGSLLALARRPAAAVGALGSGTVAMMIVVSLVLLPAFDALKSARPIGEELARRLREGERFATYPDLHEAHLFYARRFAVELGSREELFAHARRSERPLVVSRRREVAALGERSPLVELVGDPRREEGYALYGRPGG